MPGPAVDPVGGPRAWNSRQLAGAAVHAGVAVFIFRCVPQATRAVAVVAWLTLLQLTASAPVAWRNLRSRTYRPLPRFTEKEAEGFVAGTWFWAAILGILWIADDWNLESVGLRPAVPAAIGLLAGFALYLPLTLAFRAFATWRYGEKRFERSWIRSMKRFFPRTGRGRWLVRFGVVLIPFVEEISHRGILVVHLGRESGLLVPAIALGLGVSVALHLYQGPNQIPFHAAFAGLATAIALSPLGLWGSIGLHVAGDLLPFARFHRVFAARAARRAARSRAAAP